MLTSALCGQAWGSLLVCAERFPGQAPCLLVRLQPALFEGQMPAPLRLLSLAFWPL